MMTYIRSATILLIIFMFCWMLFLSLPIVVVADTWTDTFEDDNLVGWTQATTKNKDKGWDSVWKSENGVLNVTFTPLFHSNAADLLLLTALPISSTKLKVKATFIKGTLRKATLGIALGVPALGVPGKGKGLGKYYIFRSGVIHYMRLHTDGFHTKIGIPSDKLIPIIPFGQPIEIIFSEGKFQLYSNGRLYAQFFDEDYPKIEAVGIVCRGIGDETFDHQLDDFFISTDDVSFSVNGKNKLATAWGYIKRGQR